MHRQSHGGKTDHQTYGGLCGEFARFCDLLSFALVLLFDGGTAFGRQRGVIARFANSFEEVFSIGGLRMKRDLRLAGDEVHRGAFHAGRLGERFLDVRLTRRANHSVNLKGDRLRRH